jgi:membrane-bound lytic murein transglycosylase D
MRVPALIAKAALLAGVGLCLVGCATSSTISQQSFRRSFVPPAPAGVSQIAQNIEQPVNLAPTSNIAFFANEVPEFAASLPQVSRPADVDFLIKRAEDRFAAGKRAAQEGRQADARLEFDQALGILLNAPENATDRARLERRIEDLIESIYRYDVDQLGAGTNEDEVTYETSPIDDILQMTFPVDPNLRNKVREQIQATASQLPLEENDAVLSYVNFFSSTRGKKILMSGLRRSGKYKPMIEKILAEEGVPQELIFLAQAESGFTPRAVSRAKCVGIWQFAAFRGREYGLMQTASTDDRMDPDRATRAAAKHLHDLYDHFGDWYLAMAAYNCGPGCVDRAVLRTGYADFWQLRRMNVLPKETANYVPAILAMTIMAKNAKDYDLDDIAPDQALEYDTVELASPTHMALIADAVDRPLGEVRELNPSVIRLVAPSGHSVHVPKGMREQVQAALDAIPREHRDSWRIHRMEDGESLADVAKRFNTTAATLTAVNRLDEPEVGAWIAVPVSYPGDRKPVAKAVEKAASAKASRSTSSRASVRAATPKPSTSQNKSAKPKPSATVSHSSSGKRG